MINLYYSFVLHNKSSCFVKQFKFYIAYEGICKQFMLKGIKYWNEGQHKSTGNNTIISSIP